MWFPLYHCVQLLNMPCDMVFVHVPRLIPPLSRSLALLTHKTLGLQPPPTAVTIPRNATPHWPPNIATFILNHLYVYPLPHHACTLQHRIITALPNQASLSTPIVTASTFTLDSVQHGADLAGKHEASMADKDGYIYARCRSPAQCSSPRRRVVAHTLTHKGVRTGGATQPLM